MTITFNQLRKEIRSKRREKMTYQAIADFYSTDDRQVNGGTIYKILNEKQEPRDDKLRALFGLGPWEIVYPCARCGAVHPPRKICRRVKRIRRWADLPLELLRDAIVNREEWN